MVSGPENLKRRPTWIVRRAQDDSGKGTGILEFRPSAIGITGGRKTTRLNLSSKTITVSTYRKQT